MKTQNKSTKTNRWHLSAEGFLLLPSALRPHLLKCKNNNIILALLFIVAAFGINVTVETFGLVDEVSAASITMTIPSKYTIELNPSTSTTFGESANQQISIKTNASFGYSLNIKPSNDTNLKNSNGNSIIKTITKADGYESADSYKNSDEINTWAYKPSKLNSNTNTKYLPFPTSDIVIEKTTSANNDIVNTYDLTIATKVDNTLSSGTYSNSFILAATANTVSYSITYNLNDGSWTGTSPQSGSTTESSINISDVTPTKDNYEFQGWCSVTVTDNDSSSPSCSGTTINPSGSYTLSNGVNNVNLYAMWMSTGPTDLGDLGTMQNFDCSKISNTEDYGTVTDSRDNNKYKVAKLKDGKCWMIENLRIVGRSISSSNSDMTSGSFTIPASNISKFNVGLTGYSQVENSAAYVDDTYGGYYTWYTATAGTGNSSVIVANTNATGSICPKGWKLPTAGKNKGEFYNLVAAYGYSSYTGSKNLRATPVPGFTYGGYVYPGTGTLTGQGESGYYWSRTSYIAYSGASPDGAYQLHLSDNLANSGNGGTRVSGGSVRCVAQE